MSYILEKSSRQEKKWMITSPNGKKIHFGSEGYSDMSMHRNEQRRQLYINRHSTREDWTKSGINSAGFWARWILWNLPDFNQSVKDTEKRFGIKIVRK